MEFDIIEILKDIVAQKISDLHLCVGLPPMARKLSGISIFSAQQLNGLDIRKAVKKIAPHISDSELDSGKEIDLGVTVNNVARFRINIYYDRNGICVAFRLIPQEITSFDALGLPAAVRKICDLQRGLVLVTGPTGSGKSTTLASIVNHINHNNQLHIITLEDPVEYLHEHNRSLVNQREIGKDTSSFALALRAALREDPDVILVGEMRDLETISNAVTAAETGHLVLGTLHTRSAAQSVSRIIDVFPAEQQAQIRFQVAESLVMVVSQILVPGKDGKTRYLAAEIMNSNAAIKNLIRENKTYQIESIIESGSKEGMQTMDQSLKFLLDSQKIDLWTARKFAFQKQYFSR
ncbi:MAG: type IV pilus twitching motility protein PilT [Candidatus Omnitrophica bacterium]|nr:type IV pilus twitching motility protein PilT [Candidatus Omnitrophota bacterium]